MNKFFGWFTKKKIFIISLLGILIQGFSRFSIDLGICSYYLSDCGKFSYIIVIFSFIFIPVFIFSLLTLKLKEHIFNFWRNFSIFIILMFFVVINFLPLNTHGLDFFPITKGTVMFFFTIIYSIISLILIIYKSLKKE
jgi:hypothetical protein